MVMVTPVAFKLTQTVRRWATADFCPKRSKAIVSSWNPRAVMSPVLKMRGAANTASTPNMTRTMINSINVKPPSQRSKTDPAVLRLGCLMKGEDFIENRTCLNLHYMELLST